MPTMTNDTALDTSITEPSLTAGEVDMLLFALDRSRATFAWKGGGLDAEALNRQMPEPWRSVDWENDPEYPWRSAADDSPAELYRLWRLTLVRVRKSRRARGARAKG